MGRASAILCCVLMLLAGSAQAGIITINITAEITSITDIENVLMSNLKLGDTISGSYTYDSTTPDTDYISYFYDNPPLNNVGVYQHYTSPYGISLNGGGFVFQTDPANVNFSLLIENDYLGHDYYEAVSSSNLPLYEGVFIYSIGCWFKDDSASVLSSDALPLTAPVLSNWSKRKLYIIGVDPKNFTIGANVTSAELVPEPATICLLAFGGLFLRSRCVAGITTY